MLAIGALAAGAVQAGDPEAGRAIYFGAPVGGVLRGTALGVEIEGSAASCASCHRPSGFGSVEGGLAVPPVTGPALFAPRRLDRAERFRKLYQEMQPRTLYARARDPRLRPAYDEASLAVALREGRDPSGRLLEGVMPRYTLSDAQVADLAAFLRRLGAGPEPGVDGEAIHFATVFTPGVDAGERRAVEEALDAYVRRKNADTRALLARPGSSPWHHDDFVRSYREWVVHRWRLDGPPASWRSQLEARYRERPVFALVGGLGAGDWRPVHEFCEGVRLPCLFPNTDRPVLEPGGYSLYLSRGLAGEAEALAEYLRRAAGGERPAGLLQVYRDDERGRLLATTLRRSLAGSGLPLADERLPAAGPPPAWRELAAGEPPPGLVLWLAGEDLASLAAAPGWPAASSLYLSHGLLGRLPELPAGLAERALVVYPRALPAAAAPRLYRMRAWLRSHGAAGDHEALRLNTYFALTVVDHALAHLVDSFSREYLIESVEHETENGLNPGVFPRLSLGPGQRFASKGSYVVRLSAAAGGGIEPLGGWIVPRR